MSIESIVRSEFEQVAREQEKVLSGLSDDTVLLDSGWIRCASPSSWRGWKTGWALIPSPPQRTSISR